MTEMKYWYCVSYPAVYLALCIQCRRIHPETALISSLFGPTYDPRARPPFDPISTVDVEFRFDLKQIHEVNERAQIVSLLTSTYQEWRDPRLMWNVSEYGGLESLSVMYSNLWTPDTTLYNTCDMYRANVEDRGNAAIRWDGNQSGSLVQLIYNTHHTVGCRFEMTYFPFDQQNCTFVFGSWTYDQSQVDYHLDGEEVTLESYKEHEEWTLVSFLLTTRPIPYQCCKHPYKVIYAQLVIRRKSLYYVFNLVLPTILINIMASFALFASPGNAGNRHDKLQIGITTLLSYCILLLTVSDQIPRGSTSIPLISWFFLLVMLQNTLKMYVAIFLSYPDRRLFVRRIWGRMIYKATNRLGVKTVNMKEEKEDDRWPELICLWISIVVLAAITTTMFVIAYSRHY